ncbi:MAG: hypothetical protein WC381_10475 [Kiritimatiellia bacterium]|jgi:hypothetical protein
MRHGNTGNGARNADSVAVGRHAWMIVGIAWPGSKATGNGIGKPEAGYRRRPPRPQTDVTLQLDL